MVKNEEDIIKEMLNKNGRFMDFVVIDNGSTDDTYNIVKAHPKVLEHIQDNGVYDENRLIKQLLAMANKYNADWYFEIDADEIIDDSFSELNLDILDPKINCVTFKIHYRFPDGKCYKVYDYWQRLYKNLGFSEQNINTEIKKLHMGRCPILRSQRVFYHSHIPIHHYQIRSYEQGMRKYNQYVSLDIEKKYQPRGYEHLKNMANAIKTGDYSGFIFTNRAGIKRV